MTAYGTLLKAEVPMTHLESLKSAQLGLRKRAKGGDLGHVGGGKGVVGGRGLGDGRGGEKGLQKRGFLIKSFDLSFRSTKVGSPFSWAPGPNPTAPPP